MARNWAKEVDRWKEDDYEVVIRERGEEDFMVVFQVGPGVNAEREVSGDTEALCRRIVGLKRVGKTAGIRLAADELRKWANEQDGSEGDALGEAADNLGTIADRLEEEEGMTRTWRETAARIAEPATARTAMGTSAAERVREEGRREGLREAAELALAAGKRGDDLGVFHADLCRLAGTGQRRLDGGEDRDLSGAAQEVTARATIVLMAHLVAREKFFKEERGVYQPPSAAALAEATREIKAALARHRELTGDREKWRKDSAVLAAGIGILYSEPHNGELERARAAERRREINPGRVTVAELPKLYLELWRPWKLQKGKPDPVSGFAELCFERRRGER